MKQETIAIHHGYNYKTSDTMAVPICQTTAYNFGTTEHAANLFSLKELGSIYTRLNNPTTDILEARLAEMEDGDAAIATSSGQAAIFFAIANLAQAGENIIFAQKVYGGTTNLFVHTIKRFGIEARMFDGENANDLESLIDKNTRAIFFESLSNPQISIPDIEKIVSIANKYNIITICDNTVATPILFKPFDNGIDVAIHSTSKYISGQGLALGGVIIERKELNKKLANNPRYTQFNTPDESYGGLVYSTLPLPNFTLRIRLTLMRDLGATPAPFNSWLLIQSLETLSIRMKQHSKNALEIAEFLEKHPKVRSVSYPKLKSHSSHERLNKYFVSKEASGLLSFELESFEAAKTVLDNTKIFKIVANIGDSKSIITHPASTTHQQLGEKELQKAGISSSLIRLSIGLENSEDLIEDLQQALSKI